MPDEFDSFVDDVLEEPEPEAPAEPASSKDRKKVLLTTAPTIAGRKIAAMRQMISVRRVASPSAAGDIKAAASDVLGGRNKGVEKLLVEAEQECRTELQSRAAQQKADAVIGVRIEIGELQDGRLLFVAAYGTPVELQPAG